MRERREKSLRLTHNHFCKRSIMQKRTEDSTITVPIPNYKELRIGTLQSIIRQSGLPRTLFEAP
ncbi:MAG: type II toxin-antitoxin system HicA family toxin [Cyanobacteria bacterium P01_F01_bin.53]